MAAEEHKALQRRLLTGRAHRRPTCHGRPQIPTPLNTTLFWPSPILSIRRTGTDRPSENVEPKSAKRRMVSLIAVGLTLSALGVAQALGVAIPLVGYLAAALLVIGVTLVVATWLGAARGLLPVGALLAVVVLIVTAAGSALQVPVPASSHAYTA